MARQECLWTGLVWDVIENEGDEDFLFYYDFQWAVKGWEEGATLSDKTRITVYTLEVREQTV